MKIIVPMAGRGSRLRPHTLTVPKPLIPVAGKPIVHRLVTEVAKVLKTPIDEIAFILGDPIWFGDAVVLALQNLAEHLGAKASIYRQEVPLGTGHAVLCAEPSLSGPVVIAYSDTLIRATFDLDPNADGMIWTKRVDNPEAYGVVKLDSNQDIVELIEKPKTFVGNEAVIGIYYFKDAAVLKEKLQAGLEVSASKNHCSEYQINDGIKRMMAEGKVFKTGTVDEWMDCGHARITVDTNTKMLGFLSAEGKETMIAPSLKIEASKIIEPCFIGKNVTIRNSTIGPNVSVGDCCTIEHTSIKNSLIQTHTTIKNAVLEQAMIGSYVVYNGQHKSVSIGDYSTLE